MERSQLEGYLNRIGMTMPDKPTLEVLREIQERHIYAIPVENLDIIYGKLPLSFEVDDLADKVVNRRRGGLSFELNLLLADALSDLGYGVKLMSAKHPRYGHEFDHAFLMVTVPGEQGEWLVDVGYTEGIATPLLFDGRIWQSDGRDDFTFDQDGEREWRLLRRRRGEKKTVYSFELKERQAGDYVEQCNWFCTNSESRFTQGPFVFIERPEGRICLTADTVVNTYTGEQIRPVIESREAGRSALREIFGLEIEDDGDAAGSDKFGFERVFAAIGDDELQDAVVEKAVQIALDKKAHVRFGHIVKESAARYEGSFPDYVQTVRERIGAQVAEKLKVMGVADDLFGGEVVVMGSNVRIGATIDAPTDYAPEQLVEALIKPFNPDVVVCGDSGKSMLRSFIRGSSSDYLVRKLDCEVVKVSA